MTNDTADPRCVLTLERVIDAPVEKVWRCWMGGTTAQRVPVLGEPR